MPAAALNAVASTSRLGAVHGLSRDEAAVLLQLRRDENLYAFASFTYLFGQTLGFPNHTVAELGARAPNNAPAFRRRLLTPLPLCARAEVSLLKPLARPLVIEVRQDATRATALPHVESCSVAPSPSLYALAVVYIQHTSPLPPLTRAAPAPQLLLRLLAADPPRLDEDGKPLKPVSIPSNWEAHLARLLHLDADEVPEDGWLGAADPLEGASFFDAPACARLSLLRSLSERWLRDDALEADEPPSYPRSLNALWHGAPLGADAAGARYYAVPGEARVYREVPGADGEAGKWDVPATTVSEVRALANKLGDAPPSHKLLSAALAKGLLAPLEQAEANAKAEREEREEAARRDAQAVISRVSRGASLRAGVRDDAERRAKEREEELKQLAARQAEAAEAGRAALRALVPQRFRTGDWEAALFEDDAAWQPPPQGEAAVGRHVSVYWPLSKLQRANPKAKEGEFFAGTVASYDAASEKHRIAYWDGDVEEVALSEETVAWHGPITAVM